MPTDTPQPKDLCNWGASVGILIAVAGRVYSAARDATATPHSVPS